MDMLTTMAESTHPVTETTAADSRSVPAPVSEGITKDTARPMANPMVMKTTDDMYLLMTILFLGIPADTAYMSHLHWSSQAKELATSDENSIGQTMPMTLLSLNSRENTTPNTAT